MNEFLFNYIDSANEVINIINYSTHELSWFIMDGFFGNLKCASRDLMKINQQQKFCPKFIIHSFIYFYLYRNF